jgi:hypothetical protein
MAFGHALQDVPEIGEGLDVIELCRGNEGADGGPSLSPAVGAMHRILITGAAGKIGKALRAGLCGLYPVIRLSDIALFRQHTSLARIPGLVLSDSRHTLQIG